VTANPFYCMNVGADMLGNMGRAFFPAEVRGPEMHQQTYLLSIWNKRTKVHSGLEYIFSKYRFAYAYM
jgi:hypothetical protein